MRVAGTHSNLGGEEIMIVRHPDLWNELLQVITDIDATKLRTKVAQEKARRGRMLYSPVEMNKAFKSRLNARGWQAERQPFWATGDPEFGLEINDPPLEPDDPAIESADSMPILTYYQTDYVKGRVALEVQFGNYSFVAHDIFVKHRGLIHANIVDVAIEVVPMKEMQSEMSPAVPYFERVIFNIIQLGQAGPGFPLVIIGIAP